MKLVKLLLSLVCVLPLVSCALETMPDKSTNKRPPETVPLESEVYYKISEKGVVSAVDAKGNKIDLERVKLPFKHNFSAVESIKQITIIELKGSHYELICPAPSYCYMRYYPN